MKHLKRHINIAINKEYIEIQKYAFRKYKIKTVEEQTYPFSSRRTGTIRTFEPDGQAYETAKVIGCFSVLLLCRNAIILILQIYQRKTL